MPDELMNAEDDLFADVQKAYAEAAARGDGGEGKPVVEAGGEDPSDNTPPPVADKTPPQKDEFGRFVKAKPEIPAPKADGGDKSAAPAKADETPPEGAKPAAIVSGPPSSWSVKSKAAWEQLPADVRADIVKREGEVAQGFKALADYKDLKPYADMAAQGGRTLATAMKYYVDMEDLLKKDVGAGLATIAQNCGLSQAQAAQVFSGLAQKFGTVQGGGNGQPLPASNDPLFSILKPFIEPLQQELATLKQSQTSRETADRNVAEQSLAKAIETFSTAPENRYFAELGETITRLFETGMVPLTGNHANDLRTAYDTAAQMVPAVREALIEQRLQEQKAATAQKEKDAAAKAKNASRSINGSRTPGTVVTQQRTASNGRDDVEDDVRAAYRAVTQR